MADKTTDFLACAIIGVFIQSKESSVGYLIDIRKNNEILLPDEICNELEINVGDILMCEAAVDSSAIIMSKHCNQALSDDEITAAGNLTRVILLQS
ncbi:hypothetical protein [Rheinheimera sp. 1928-s]|uniref:hypothetical protein n=1 Tax=Rheinheimera sp. 1928-s TaxID=3033803 RepID=UPI00262971C4|nr:hypothetical protein [Rheinheimera sp. 1928-s]